MDAPSTPTLVDQLHTITQLNKFFGLRPFEIVPTGRRRFARRTSPSGVVMYILNLSLFAVSAGFYYNFFMQDSASLSRSRLYLIQDRVYNHIVPSLYILTAVGLLRDHSTMHTIAELWTKLEGLFAMVNRRRPFIAVRWYAKGFVFVFSFARLFTFAYYELKARMSFRQMVTMHFMVSLPNMGMQFCVVSFVVYAVALKVYWNMLNEVLEGVLREMG